MLKALAITNSRVDSIMVNAGVEFNLAMIRDRKPCDVQLINVNLLNT